MELLAILDEGDLVVVRAGIGGRIRLRYGDVVAEVVKSGRRETGKGVDELSDARREVAGARVPDDDAADSTAGSDRGQGAGALIGLESTGLVESVIVTTTGFSGSELNLRRR